VGSDPIRGWAAVLGLVVLAFLIVGLLLMATVCSGASNSGNEPNEGRLPLPGGAPALQYVPPLEPPHLFDDLPVPVLHPPRSLTRPRNIGR
jgi:hypothetical protein